MTPDVRLVGVYSKTLLLQIADGASVLVSCGVGFTIMETVCPEGPLLQPFALVITTYETVIGDGVEFVNCSLIEPAPLLAAWVIPVTDALVHVNELPVVALDSV